MTNLFARRFIIYLRIRILLGKVIAGAFFGVGNFGARSGLSQLAQARATVSEFSDTVGLVGLESSEPPASAAL